ncbi:MAG: 7-carboxy-7-deazaguanine synthase QueE [Bacteroidales bacterium]|nr:7-carboxy-7-deazaguanine synthase QueE [Bacteroidales bacterium]
MEEFYSLQGEGFNTGQAAYFVRIGGCDVGCKWCDVKESWNAFLFPPSLTDLIIEHVLQNPAKAVVVTGGEPLLYNLEYLCRELKRGGVRTFLETSGSQPLSGEWDWICLSPKKESPPLHDVVEKANELKVIIEDSADFSWAEENAELVSNGCILYLQPEWSQREKIMPQIIYYIQANPKWKISLQSHKYMSIP